MSILDVGIQFSQMEGGGGGGGRGETERDKTQYRENRLQVVFSPLDHGEKTLVKH
jgi:hypothetical protein